MKIFAIILAAFGVCLSACGQVNQMMADTNGVVRSPTNIWTANLTGIRLALDLDTLINAGVPNGSGALVHWSKLLGVPAGFADGTDDGARDDPYDNFSNWEEAVYTFEGASTTAALEPGMTFTAVASGNIANTVAVSGRQGLAIITAASAALNTGGFIRGLSTGHYLTNTATQMKIEFYLPTTNGVRLRLGWNDSATTSDPVDGVYLSITNDTMFGIAISNNIRSQTTNSFILSPNVNYEADLRQTNNFFLVTLRTNKVVAFSEMISDRVPLGIARLTGISVGGIGTGTNSTNAGQILVVDSMMPRRQK